MGGYLVYINNKKNHTKGMLSPTIPEDKEQSSQRVIEEPNWKNPYDMNYLKDVKKWLGKRKIRKLPHNKAREYARILKRAKGRWRDDTQAVTSVFTQIKDKTQVASISKAFWVDYKKDMWQYLRSFLSAKEMEKYVHRPVRKLDNYSLI
ncbi:hypothetical protein HN014_10745 [Aquimarina sp. TRL1]|nr:hypothetical protein HN014_10745 [Aquimarina sp. TRL1]